MKLNIRMISGYLILGTILSYSFYGIARHPATADSDYSGDYISPVTNQLYVEECGACHIAYPAQLLPAASWRKIMAGLEDHFEENAELDADTRSTIEDYLAGFNDRHRYRKLFRNLGKRTPVRITELPYFIHEHDEIPSRLIEGNEKVGSISQCNACHRGAEQGQFDEDDVVIEGFGRWDD